MIAWLGTLTWNKNASKLWNNKHQPRTTMHHSFIKFVSWGFPVCQVHNRSSLMGEIWNLPLAFWDDMTCKSPFSPLSFKTIYIFIFKYLWVYDLFKYIGPLKETIHWLLFFKCCWYKWSSKYTLTPPERLLGFFYWNLQGVLLSILTLWTILTLMRFALLYKYKM